MSATLEWLQRPWLLSVVYSGEVTADDYRQVTEYMLQAVHRNPLYSLVDVSLVQAVPRDTIHVMFSMDAYAQLMRSPNMRTVAYVGTTHQLRLSINMITRTVPVIFADNRTEALAALQRDRAKEETEICR